jgi:hypothetical protein
MEQLPPLEQNLSKATEIWLSGVVLQRTIRDNIAAIDSRLAEGARVRIILLNPESLAAQETADDHFPLNRLKAHFSATWENLKWLASRPNSKGTLEIRTSNERCYFNLVAIDPNKSHGLIYVELRPQRWINGRKRPRFELRPRRDGHWFEYYKEQFESLWPECQPMDASSD